MTENKINANYLLYQELLQKYNCYSEEMFNDIGEKIKLAPFSLEKSWGGCYDGGLIDVTINSLCKIGIHVNQNALEGNNGNYLHPLICANKNMLIRTLLLKNIAKSVMMRKPIMGEWHKKDQNYVWVDNSTIMKVGERSQYLCQKYGIKLEEEEFKAFRTAEIDDIRNLSTQSPLVSVVYISELLCNCEITQKASKEIIKETIEL